MPPPPPPPPPKSASSKTKTDVQKVIAKPDTIYEAEEKKAPEDKPKEEEKDDKGQDDGEEGGVEGGVAGGVADGGVLGGVLGGVVGGVLGGQLGGTGTVPAPTSAVLPFGAGMNRPTMISGRDPTYTRDALAARVEGLMIVKCVITTSGSLQNCRVIKSLPFMDQAVLEALAGRRYTPVMYQGRAVSVEYVFNIKLVLP